MAPFISLAWNGTDYRAEGQHACDLGHRIPRAGSSESDGIYCGWHWDGKRLLVYGDRYGMFPLFYCYTANRLLVSPSLASLIEQGAPFEWDYSSLYLFLHLGLYVGERTPFEHVRTVPPCAEFSWKKGILKCAGRFPRVSPQRLSRKAAVDGFIALFRQAISRRAPPNSHYAVPLSGGRDSRFILLELRRQGQRDPFCITARRSRYERDPDVELACALARRLGLSHVTVEPPPSPVASQHERNLRTHFCSVEHEWYLPIAARLDGAFSSVYDGIAGDVTTDILGHGHCNVETSRRYEAGDFNVIAREFIGNRESTLRRLVSPVFFRHFDPRTARSLLCHELERHAHAPNPVASFFFWNRTRRAVGLIPYGLLSSIARVYSPFLDHDLFDFLTSLPWRDVADNQLRKDTLRRAYPNFTDLPFADDQPVRPSERASRQHDMRYARELLRKMLVNRTPRPWIVRRTPVVSLLAASASSRATNRRYAWTFDWLVYLLQLEELVARSRSHK